MTSWNCCRTCLNTECLHPIFNNKEHKDIYTQVILTTTGLSVALNDGLPQLMCSVCIDFINNAYEFRKKCSQTNIKLLEHLKTDQYKTETLEQNFSRSDNKKHIFIDISDILIDEYFRDYDDNVTLDTLRCNNYEVTVAKEENEEILTKTETNDGHAETVLASKNDVPKQRKRIKRSKKENEEENKSRRKKENVKERIECEYCHKILTSRFSLRNHNKIHTGFDVVCEHCGKKFINRRLLLMHCRAKHGYEKTDKCSYCDYRGSNAEQVKIHERLHTGEKPYVCAQCGAGFHRNSSYLQHMDTHLPEKTVQVGAPIIIQCDQCPARFKSLTLMRIHKNRHRPPQYTFQCRVCDDTFARRRNVARHLQRKHRLPPDAHNIHRLKIH